MAASGQASCTPGAAGASGHLALVPLVFQAEAPSWLSPEDREAGQGTAGRSGQQPGARGCEKSVAVEPEAEVESWLLLLRFCRALIFLTCKMGQSPKARPVPEPTDAGTTHRSHISICLTESIQSQLLSSSTTAFTRSSSILGGDDLLTSAAQDQHLRTIVLHSGNPAGLILEFV